MTKSIADIHTIRGNYELIDHTADIGICVRAATCEEIFARSAAALFDLMVDISEVDPATRIEIDLEADSLEELFVLWLNELLFRADVEGMFFSRFEVDSVSEHVLKASVAGDAYREDIHTMDLHVKAATYHQLEVSKSDEGWIARVIFDI
jgi:SHS2 domain-containing protein